MEGQEDLKETFRSLITGINRPGIDKVWDFLVESDFFIAPASTRFHSSFEGGLAVHSLEVYHRLLSMVDDYGLNVPLDSIKICGLLHDLCKANVYKKTVKNVKDGTRINWKGQEVANWIEKEVFEFDDPFFAGHGDKTVIMLQPMITLTQQEIMMIRWHMGPWAVREDKEWNNATKYHPEIVAMFCADMIASRIFEKQGE